MTRQAQGLQVACVVRCDVQQHLGSGSLDSVALAVIWRCNGSEKQEVKEGEEGEKAPWLIMIDVASNAAETFVVSIHGCKCWIFIGQVSRHLQSDEAAVSKTEMDTQTELIWVTCFRINNVSFGEAKEWWLQSIPSIQMVLMNRFWQSFWFLMLFAFCFGHSAAIVRHACVHLLR